MKKRIILCLVGFLCMSMVACNANKNDTDSTAAETKQETVAQETDKPVETEANETESVAVTESATTPETAPATESVTEPAVHEHVYGEWDITPSTCTEAGNRTKACECGDTVTETIEALGHTEVIDEAVTPTASEAGLTEGKHCSVCNEILVEQETVPATGSLGLAYEANDDGETCTVIGMGTCTDTEVYIPEAYDGYRVTAIGKKAFADQSQLTAIHIPNTVRTIGMRAFAGCTGITEMTIPESVWEIGTQIFWDCDNLSTVHYNSLYGSSENSFLNIPSITTVIFGGTIVPSYILQNNTTVRNISILDGVKYIKWGAFSGCTGLTEIIIPEGVTDISGAFRGCTGLTEIIIPEGVTNISGAFSGCTELAEIVIPEGVTSIGSGAFSGCTELAEIIIPEGVTSIGESTFYGCTGLTDIVIPEGVTSIGYYAFYGCTGLTEIVIPEGVTSIGESTFEGCTGLTEIVIPEGMTSIGYYAFYGCTGLTEIVIPEGVTNIGTYAFLGCTKLAEIVIPESVTSIGFQAFDCYTLSDIYFEGTTQQWNNMNFKWYDSLTVHCKDGDIKYGT